MSKVDANQVLSKYAGTNNNGVEENRIGEILRSRLYLHGYLSVTSGINDFTNTQNQRAQEAREMGIKDGLGDLGKD